MSSAAVEMHARSRIAQRRNTEARNAVVSAARLRFGLPADMRTAEVLWFLATELREGTDATNG